MSFYPVTLSTTIIPPASLSMGNRLDLLFGLQWFSETQLCLLGFTQIVQPNLQLLSIHNFLLTNIKVDLDLN